MKVILLTDVAKVGRRGEIKEVPDGFGRNFLLAGGKAKIATPDAVAALSKKQAVETQSKNAEAARIDEAIGKLATVQLFLDRGHDMEGNLFAGLKREEVAAELVKTHRVAIPADCFDLDKPIKKIGKYDIPIARKGGVKGVLHLVVR